MLVAWQHVFTESCHVICRESGYWTVTLKCVVAGQNGPAAGILHSVYSTLREIATCYTFYSISFVNPINRFVAPDPVIQPRFFLLSSVLYDHITVCCCKPLSRPDQHNSVNTTPKLAETRGS